MFHIDKRLCEEAKSEKHESGLQRSTNLMSTARKPHTRIFWRGTPQKPLRHGGKDEYNGCRFDMQSTE